MAHFDRSITIVSDSDSSEDVDTTDLLRHSYHTQSRGNGFNVHSVPIGSIGVLPGQKQNDRRHRFDSDKNANTIDQKCDKESSDFVQIDVASSTNCASGMDSYDIRNYEDNNVMYIYNGCPFTDRLEEERKQVLKGKKKKSLICMLLLGLIAMFQSVGYVLYLPDILLLNVSDDKSQRVSYVILLVSCLLSTMMSHAVINSIGHKWSIFIGCFGAAIFTMARFFASMAFLVPAAILTGLSTGPMLVGIITSMNQLAQEYSSLSGNESRNIMCYFSGFLHTCTLLSPALSALLRYAFLPSESVKSFTDEHSSIACYKDFCWTSNFSLAIFEQDQINQREPAEEFRLQALLGFFFTCALGASLLAWFNSEGDERLWNEEPSVSNAGHSKCPVFVCACKCTKVKFEPSWLTEPIRTFCKPNMMLLVPLFVYLGVQQYLVYSIFVQTYSQCSSQLIDGITMAITLSVVGAFCSIPVSFIIIQVGKVKVILPAIAVQFILIIVMATVNSMNLTTQYIIAAFFGAADGMLHATIIVIIRDVFQEVMDTSVVCLRACQIVGYILIITLQLCQACNYVILIFSISLLTLATLCYVSMEIKIRLEHRESRESGSQYVPLLCEASWLPHVNPVEVRRDRMESLSPRVPFVD